MPWHVHDEDGHVVVLLMTGEHMVEQVLEQTPGSVLQVLRSARGDADQLVQPGVEAAHPVLHEPVGVNAAVLPGGSRNACCLRGLGQPSGVPASAWSSTGRAPGVSSRVGRWPAFPAWPSPVSGSITR